MHNKISACLVIYNEEKVLRRCLESLKNIVDEIIIVHDGDCTDTSLEIAKKYTEKIFVQPHIGEAEYHRPFCYSKASGDWILHIDADEYLGERAKEKIKQLVQSNKYSAFAFRWPVFLHSKNKFIKNGPYAKQVRLCLYKKDLMYTLGLTHYHPKTLGVIKKCINITLWHKPNKPQDSFSNFYKKYKPWALLEREQTEIYKELPFYGNDIAKNKAYLELSNRLKHKFLYCLFEILKRIGWYIKNGGLSAGFTSVKIFYLDLSRLLLNLKVFVIG